MASRSDRGSGIGSLAQHCATAISTLRMRSENAGKTCALSQERRTAPCAGSLRSTRSRPVSSSRIVITDKKSLVAETLFAQFTTLLSAFPDFAFLNSDITLVSSKYMPIMISLRNCKDFCLNEVVQNQCRQHPAWPVTRQYFLFCP